MTILNIKTFLTFVFDPSLFSRLLTQIWTKSKDFLGLYWGMIRLQNCKDEIVEKFDPALKNGKIYCMHFFFCRVYNYYILIG